MLVAFAFYQKPRGCSSLALANFDGGSKRLYPAPASDTGELESDNPLIPMARREGSARSLRSLCESTTAQSESHSVTSDGPTNITDRTRDVLRLSRNITHPGISHTVRLSEGLVSFTPPAHTSSRLTGGRTQEFGDNKANSAPLDLRRTQDPA